MSHLSISLSKHIPCTHCLIDEDRHIVQEGPFGLFIPFLFIGILTKVIVGKHGTHCGPLSPPLFLSLANAGSFLWWKHLFSSSHSAFTLS